MKLMTIIAILLVVFITGAVSHERDILNKCKNSGQSSMAMWTGKIKCEVIE